MTDPQVVSRDEWLVARKQLLAREWDEGCPSCSFVIDHIGYQFGHLHARDTSLVAISRAPIEKLAAHKRRMGWTIPWYSSYGSDFNYDFHVILDPAVAPVEYNYQRQVAAMGLPKAGSVATTGTAPSAQAASSWSQTSAG